MVQNKDRGFGVIVLAAGKGTRMQSDDPKVLHKLAGRPMLEYVLRAAYALKPSKVCVVVGHQGDEVKKVFSSASDIEWVTQVNQRGTGDAVAQSADIFKGFEDPVLVLYGDIPGIKSETLRRLRMLHDSGGGAVTLLTAELEDPTGYGRVLVSGDGHVSKIVEERDATAFEREIQEINTGIGIYDPQFLFSSVKKLKPANKQRELYLTDLVEMARQEGRLVTRMQVKDPAETLGVNDREGLADAMRFFFDDKAKLMLERGVSLEDPAAICIEPRVMIEKDVEIESFTCLRGDTYVSAGCRLASSAVLVDTVLGANTRIACFTQLQNVRVGENSTIDSGCIIGEDK